MKRSNSFPGVYLKPVGCLLLLGMLMICSGCQTFSLSDEQFRAQQNGGVADPDTGAVVGTAGTLGYYGATLGALIASLTHK